MGNPNKHNNRADREKDGYSFSAELERSIASISAPNKRERNFGQKLYDEARKGARAVSDTILILPRYVSFVVGYWVNRFGDNFVRDVGGLEDEDL